MGDPVPATMDDLKGVETNLTSLIDARMSKMLEMIECLTVAKESSKPSPLEDSDARDGANAKPLGGDEEEDEETKKKKEFDKNASGSSLKSGEPKDYHNVPWLFPDAPVPHPHINNRGEPPKLDAINFGT